VKKVDEFEHVVVMRIGTKVHIDDIAEIDGEIFEMLE
jgi:L-lysine 2,3-aminomutase